MAAFMLGWAGLSVHCQVLAFLGDSGLSMRTYLVGKLLHGGLSAALLGLLVPLLPLEAPVSAYLAEQTETLAAPGLSAGPHHLHRGRLGHLAAVVCPGPPGGEKKQWKKAAPGSIIKVKISHQEKEALPCPVSKEHRTPLLLLRPQPPPDADQVVCDKKGVMSGASHCRAFRYDPLKRVPPRPAKADFSGLKDEDFQL